MKNLIVPCCGRSFINGMPKYLNLYPDGIICAKKTLENIDPNLYDTIYYVLLEEDIKHYNADEVILNALSDINIKKKIVSLNKMTNGPAETVYEAIRRADITGSLIIKDVDNLLSLKEEEGNFVAGLNLVHYTRNVFDISKKSFLIMNEHHVILDIVEKRVCSDVISAGVYGFENVEDFIWAYENLQDKYYPITQLYVSHLISYLIGMKKKTFKVVDVSEYESWGSDREWEEAVAYYYEHNPKDKLLLIDLDGTLVDTLPVNYHAYKQALKEEGFDLTQGYFYECCNGTNYKAFLPPILGDKSEKLITKIHDRKLELYKRYLAEGELNDFLVGLIKSMKNRYYVVLVTTASKANANELLDYFHLNNLFDKIITAEDVTQLKPSPEGFEKAISHFGIDKRNVVVFEDSEVGVQAAKNAGIKCYQFKG